MSKTNKRSEDNRFDVERVAGGFGAPAAKQDAASLLRRCVLANLLWEDLAYQDGTSLVDRIRALVPSVDPQVVSEIAEEARIEQKLRHVPLLLARECARHPSHRGVVADLLPRIIRRPDELAEFLALYWQDDADQPLAASVKKGLAIAFRRFDTYQLAKYNQKNEIKLRDVMFLVHPQPRDEKQALAFRQLANDELPIPDTWEVALSTGKDKRETWERLIGEGRLGALAFLRNLRNMENVGVSREVIRNGFDGLKVDWLLPLNFFAAAQAAPSWTREIEDAMFKSFAQVPKLPGLTHFIVDVSGSMQCQISGRSAFTRLDAGAALAVLANEMCEHSMIWATAGSDWQREHQTKLLVPHRGFALAGQVRQAAHELGGGGIFTRQCLDHIRSQTDDYGSRTVIFSDSQDCDNVARAPQPFSPYNYIIDVSSHERGINYSGVWTAEINGWSESFLRYIYELEHSLQ